MPLSNSDLIKIDELIQANVNMLQRKLEEKFILKDEFHDQISPIQDTLVHIDYFISNEYRILQNSVEGNSSNINLLFNNNA